ncbi:hypothetical protein D9M70_390750 [compost metagenome]
MDRAQRHHAMVDFQQHCERRWVVLEEDHLKVLNAKWTPVGDGLPAEDEIVLAFNGESIRTAWQHNSFWFGKSWSDDVDVTHWMPLPAAPKVQTGYSQPLHHPQQTGRKR